MSSRGAFDDEYAPMERYARTERAGLVSTALAEHAASVRGLAAMGRRVGSRLPPVETTY